MAGSQRAPSGGSMHAAGLWGSLPPPRCPLLMVTFVEHKKSPSLGWEVSSDGTPVISGGTEGTGKPTHAGGLACAHLTNNLFGSQPAPAKQPCRDSTHC